MTVPSKNTINQGLRIRNHYHHHHRSQRYGSSTWASLECLLKVFVVVVGIIVVYNGWHAYEDGELSSSSSTLSSTSSSSSGQPLPDPQKFHSQLEEGNGSATTTTDYVVPTKYQQEPSKYHVVFSTGCSTYQDWQSYVAFYHVMKSGQEGHVTRIASGCTGTDLRDIYSIFEDEIGSMSPKHHLHLTPDYSKVHKGRAFKYFNKPFGMRHWMQYALGYPENHAQHDDSIVILLDPDQILLRPFTNDFTNSSEKYRVKEHKLKVEHGSPFAQQYGYGLQWKDKVDLNHVFNGEPTPVSNMTRKEGFDWYIGMGPPYIATAKDMWSIVSKWAEIVPRVHEDYPHLLAEMFGYNLAAAHLGLRHTIAHSFMVSDIWAGMEGWQLVTKVERKDICHNFPKSEYPHVIHYCQRYYLGKWFIGKHRLRKDFISCEAPLLAIPPADIALRYDYAILPDNNERKDLKEKGVKQEAFMVCAMIDALNAAAYYYKDQHCHRVTANYNYSYVFFDDMSLPEDNKKLAA